MTGMLRTAPMLLATALVLPAFAKNASPARLHTPTEYAGLIVPGGLAEVKRTGFSDCEPGYYGYACKKPFSFGGVKAKSAEVRLDGKNNRQVKDYLSGPSGDVRALRPELLSYRSVTLRFNDNRPFLAALEKDGWQRVDRRRATYYVKAGVSVWWSVERHGIEFVPVTAADVATALDDAAQRQSNKLKLDDNAAAVMKQLKQ